MANRDTSHSNHGAESIPTPDPVAPSQTTSKTIGYDSAQKSGYDTEQENHEARSTVNDVHTQGKAAERERADDESDARRDQKDTGPGAKAGDTARKVAEHAGSGT